MVEEDTVPPDGVFEKMLYVTEGISFVDYGVEGWSCSARDKTNTVLWCGMGCTMIKKEVFLKLEKPWFRSDKQLRLSDNTWIDVPPDKTYGGQDIWFCTKAREAGFSIKQVDGECKHLRLEALGMPGINNGVHTIGSKKTIETQQIINLSS